MLKRFIVGFAVAFAFACSSGGGDAPSDEMQGDGTGGEQADGEGTGGTGGGPQCFGGTACFCDGLPSQSICFDDGTEECDCAACPEFAPSTAPEFTPCGGEPFGVWHQVAVDWSGYSLPVSDGRSCAVHGTEDLVSDDMRLDLQSGGVARWLDAAGTIGFRMLASCIAPCGSIEGSNSTITCTDAGCGTCDCTMEGRLFDEEASWTRSDTALTFTKTGFLATSIEYCVEGSTMTVRQSSGVVTTLEKVVGQGTPSACSLRSVDTCTLGTGCGMGLCVGGTDCTEAGTESECTVIAGCSWDPETCSGEAPEECDLSDYDVVPGCSFVPTTGSATCTGTRTACSTVESEVDCAANPGCTWEPACAGGDISCSDYDDSALCSQLPDDCYFDGYEYDGNYYGLCLGGPFSCADVDPSVCASVDGCEDVSCTGEATPCGQLSAADCETAAGCTLVVAE